MRLSVGTPAQRVNRHSRLAVGTLCPASKVSLATGGRHSHSASKASLATYRSTLPPRERSITRDYRSPLFAQQSITRYWRSAPSPCDQSITRDGGRHPPPSDQSITCEIDDRHHPPGERSITCDWRSALSAQQSITRDGGRHSPPGEQIATRDGIVYLCPASRTPLAIVALRPASKASLVTAVDTPDLRAKHHSRLSIVTLRPAIKVSLATSGRHSPHRERSITRNCRSACPSPRDQSIIRDYWSSLFARECIICDYRSPPSPCDQSITHNWRSPLATSGRLSLPNKGITHNCQLSIVN